MRTAIVIPARYASTRLPGKPLAMIAGHTMLSRVITLARNVQNADAIYIATDDTRIADYAKEFSAKTVMTDTTCASGTDRVAQAIMRADEQADFVINLQGDAPLTPPAMLDSLIEAFNEHHSDIVTPVCQLSWASLDRLRENKCTTPFSGTCATFHPHTYHAYWFSKNIIPALRNETKLRNTQTLSPIYQHIGLYGYRRESLLRYATLPNSVYESYEGLEQLRLLEAGMDIRCVPVNHQTSGLGGVDSPDDITRVEAYLQKHGDPIGEQLKEQL